MLEDSLCIRNHALVVGSVGQGGPSAFPQRLLGHKSVANTDEDADSRYVGRAMRIMMGMRVDLGAG